MGDEKRDVGILGNRAVIKALTKHWADADGVVRCVSCDRTDITWHHVVPIGIGGADRMRNIVPLCTDCCRLLPLRNPAQDPDLRQGNPQTRA